MRIAVVNKLLVPSGSVRWSTGLSHGLRSLGHQVSTIFIRASESSNSVAPLLTDLNVEILQKGTRAVVSEILGYPVVLWWMRGAFTRESSPDPISWTLTPLRGHWGERFDLVVAHDELTAVTAMVTRLFSQTPYVVYLQESYPISGSFWLGLLQSRIRKSALSRAKLLVANSEDVAQSYQAALNVRAATITHGCDPATSIELRKQNYVLADTRWTSWRNPMFLLELARRTDRLDFVLAGSFASDWLRTQFLAERERLGLLSRVKVQEGLNETELSEYYRNALAYVRWAARDGSRPIEGGPSFGVFQALAEGCPTLIDDCLGSAAFLRREIPEFVVKHDPVTYIHRLHELLSRPQLTSELAFKAWELSKKYSWKVRAQQMLDELRTTGFPI